MTGGKQKENSEGVRKGKEQDEKRGVKDWEKGEGETKAGRGVKDKRKTK